MTSLQDELKKQSHDNLSERAAAESMQGQMYELREQLKIALLKSAEAHEEFSKGESRMPRCKPPTWLLRDNVNRDNVHRAIC